MPFSSTMNDGSSSVLGYRVDANSRDLLGVGSTSALVQHFPVPCCRLKIIISHFTLFLASLYYSHSILCDHSVISILSYHVVSEPGYSSLFSTRVLLQGRLSFEITSTYSDPNTKCAPSERTLGAGRCVLHWYSASTFSLWTHHVKLFSQ